MNVIKTVQQITGEIPKLELPLEINGKMFSMEMDTATTWNFLSEENWIRIGQPKLETLKISYESASKHQLPLKGTFIAQTSYNDEKHPIEFAVTNIANLNFILVVILERISFKLGKF